MKEIAKLLVRHKLPVIRPRPKEGRQPTASPETETDNPIPSRPSPQRRTHPRSSPERTKASGTGDTDSRTGDISPHSVYAVPDAWEVTVRDLPAEGEDKGEEARRPGPRRMDPIKTRRTAMSLSVSQEEEALLRTFAAKKGMTFSSWARQTLFLAMGRKLPQRDRGP